MISPQTLKKLNDILREDFGKNLSDREIEEIGRNLINLFEELLNFKDQSHG